MIYTELSTKLDSGRWLLPTECTLDWSRNRGVSQMILTVIFEGSFANLVDAQGSGEKSLVAWITSEDSFLQLILIYSKAVWHKIQILWAVFGHNFSKTIKSI